MSIDLTALGFTQEELQKRVVNQICDQLMRREYEDEDGPSYFGESELKRKLDAEIKERINATVEELAEKHILPNVGSYIENLTLQATNKWGEKTGSSLTFVEYLTQRAEAYMNEQVDFQGRDKASVDYSWKGTQTRLTHLVHHHLHYSIETAMKQALQIATSSIASGLQETVKLKLDQIAKDMKVTVSTK